MKPRRAQIAARMVLMLALAVALTDLVGQALAPASPPPSVPLPRIDPYGTNPFIRTGRPYLLWHTPGARYLQATPAYTVTYAIDAAGFRGAPAPAAPPAPAAADTRLLLLVGDSLVEGAGAEFADTFPARLDTALRPAGWSARNAAMQGGSPLYYLLNLPRYITLHPDALLVILTENDLYEDRLREAAYASLKPVARGDGPLGGAHPARYRPGRYVQGLAERAAIALRWYLHPTPDETLLRAHAAAWSRRLTAAGADVPVHKDPALLADAWPLTQTYLDRLADACAHAGIRFCIATLNLQPLLPERRDQQPIADLLDRSAAAWAASRHVPFRALAQAIPSAQLGELIFPDAHLTPAGHARLAPVIQAWLAPHLPPRPAVEAPPHGADR